MTGKIVNLRQARKRRARAETKRAADESAARFGQSKAERRLTEAEDAKTTRTLDNARRGVDDPPPDDA